MTEKIRIAEGTPKGNITGKANQKYFLNFLPAVDEYSQKVRLEILAPSMKIDPELVEQLNNVLQEMKGHKIRSLSFSDRFELRKLINELAKSLGYFEYKSGEINPEMYEKLAGFIAVNVKKQYIEGFNLARKELKWKMKKLMK